MEIGTVAKLHAAGRVAVGGALTLLPGLAGPGWVGSAAEDPRAAVLSRALGVRDAAIGLGVLWTIEDVDAARPWLLACVAADTVDCLASLARRDVLPAAGHTAVPLVAAASALVGAWLAAALD
jgi:hypothetical protein